MRNEIKRILVSVTAVVIAITATRFGWCLWTGEHGHTIEAFSYMCISMTFMTMMFIVRPPKE